MSYKCCDKLYFVISWHPISTFHQDIDKSINHLIKFNLHEVDSVDENNNQNGAIRVMRLNSVFQNSLSTHFGVVKTNINDIHTKKDLQKLRSKENVL